MKGRIQKRLEVWCGKCSCWEYLEHTKMVSAKAEAIKKGWKFTKKNGWLCEECQFQDILEKNRDN